MSENFDVIVFFSIYGQFKTKKLKIWTEKS